MIGDGARALVARALGNAPDGAVEATLATFQLRYAERPCVHTTLLDGAAEILGIGLPLAVVTNKPRHLTLLVLESLGIASSFVTVWAGGDGALKPAPDGPRMAAAALGVAPGDAWVVGDGPQDVLAGHAAGCFTVAVPGIADRESVIAAKPDVVASSLTEVVDLVRRANA
jgi:phosphoglycolate phosphatase